MIKYALKCSNGHPFESWFASSTAYERLQSTGQVVCPSCGNHSVEKALMAPSKAAPGALHDAPSDKAALLTKLRQHLASKSEDVGSQFATEARAIHEGDAPERAIHGQAKPEEARELIKDGVPILPLPLRPKKEVN